MFKDERCTKAEPGQFLMLWIPGTDEIPLSILDARADRTISVAVKKVGEATKALHCMKVGEVVGIRGPFGNHFSIKKGRILMVGGGTGIAPLVFLTKRVKQKTKKLVFLIGAKSRGELLFIDALQQLCNEGNIIATTEDGSYGLKCIATVPLRSLLANEKFDIIYTCGPEQMMKKVFAMAEKHRIPLEASIERLMRCAIGLCGSCVIGKYRVCKDGTVFTGEQLTRMTEEFGISKRDFTGRKIPLC
jgi:dihydroorotate dehydrogenase electron transfer subunit